MGAIINEHCAKLCYDLLYLPAVRAVLRSCYTAEVSESLLFRAATSEHGSVYEQESFSPLTM